MAQATRSPARSPRRSSPETSPSSSDCSTDLEADGSVIDGGTPLADALAFGQWNAARRLLERGATANLWQAAAMGQLTHVQKLVAAPASPTAEEITNAFWCACHGGRRATAAYLLDHGADMNWIGHDNLTPARRRCPQRQPPPRRLASNPRRQDRCATAIKPMDKAAARGVP